MIVSRRLLISGRVQGVGFRFFAEAQAAVEGVHGYVRNLPDGRVEAVIEGDQESVDRVEGGRRPGARGGPRGKGGGGRKTPPRPPPRGGITGGDQESVDRVERALRRGPGGARVESVEVESIPPTGRATGFSIR